MKYEHKEWWGCKRKEAFGKTGAEFLAKKRSKATKSDIRAYKCLYCEYWHIGHHKKRYDPPPIEPPFTLPPPDPDYVFQRIYEAFCDYCWEDIPHTKDEHGYSLALKTLAKRSLKENKQERIMKTGKRIEIERSKNCIAVRVSQDELYIEHLIPMSDIPALISELSQAHKEWLDEPHQKDPIGLIG